MAATNVSDYRRVCCDSRHEALAPSPDGSGSSLIRSEIKHKILHIKTCILTTTFSVPTLLRDDALYARDHHHEKHD
jgi:hypothetical protein